MSWFRARFSCHDVYELSGEALARRGFSWTEISEAIRRHGAPAEDEW